MGEECRKAGPGLVVEWYRSGHGWLAGDWVGSDGVRGWQARALEETMGVYESRGGSRDVGSGMEREMSGTTTM